MTRYYTTPRRTKACWDDDAPLLPNLTVSDHEPQDTGLIDIDGNAIYRAPEPMGFIREDTFAQEPSSRPEACSTAFHDTGRKLRER